METNVNLLNHTIDSVEFNDNQNPIFVHYKDRYNRSQQYLLTNTEQKLLNFYLVCPEFIYQIEITENLIPCTRLERITMQHVINSI